MNSKRQGTADPPFQRQCTSEPSTSAMLGLDSKGGDMADPEASILVYRITRQRKASRMVYGRLAQASCSPYTLLLSAYGYLLIKLFSLRTQPLRKRCQQKLKTR